MARLRGCEGASVPPEADALRVTKEGGVALVAGAAGLNRLDSAFFALVTRVPFSLVASLFSWKLSLALAGGSASLHAPGTPDVRLARGKG